VNLGQLVHKMGFVKTGVVGTVDKAAKADFDFHKEQKLFLLMLNYGPHNNVPWWFAATEQL
jgi:hypothetical protein